MPLSWNEIRDRAIAFSKEWEGEKSERAEAQSFWNEFFEVFGIQRRRVATFEKQVDLSKAIFGILTSRLGFCAEGNENGRVAISFLDRAKAYDHRENHPRSHDERDQATGAMVR